MRHSVLRARGDVQLRAPGSKGRWEAPRPVTEDTRHEAIFGRGVPLIPTVQFIHPCELREGAGCARARDASGTSPKGWAGSPDAPVRSWLRRSPLAPNGLATSR